MYNNLQFLKQLKLIKTVRGTVSLHTKQKNVLGLRHSGSLSKSKCLTHVLSQIPKCSKNSLHIWQELVQVQVSICFSKIGTG